MKPIYEKIRVWYIDYIGLQKLENEKLLKGRVSNYQVPKSPCYKLKHHPSTRNIRTDLNIAHQNFTYLIQELRIKTFNYTPFWHFSPQ